MTVDLGHIDSFLTEQERLVLFRISSVSNISRRVLCDRLGLVLRYTFACVVYVKRGCLLAIVIVWLESRLRIIKLRDANTYTFNIQGAYGRHSKDRLYIFAILRIWRSVLYVVRD